MPIQSQNAVLNQFVPPFCVDSPVSGEALLYDPNKKTWRNRLLTAADLGGIVPETLTWTGTYSPGDVVTIGADNVTFEAVARSEFGNGPGGGATKLNDLSDVAIISPLDNQSFLYDTVSGKWINKFASYNDLTDIPLSFTPEAHTHLKADITDFVESDYATSTHTHLKADITDFVESDYATSAQGSLADSALQSNDNVSLLVNDAGYITLADLPTSSASNRIENTDTLTFVETNDVNEIRSNWHNYTPGSSPGTMLFNDEGIKVQTSGWDGESTDYDENGGAFEVYTGGSVNGEGGLIALVTGESEVYSGWIEMSTGDSSLGDSGDIEMYTGRADKGYSGSLYCGSGWAGGADRETGDSGSVYFDTGTSNQQSGGIYFNTGHSNRDDSGAIGIHTGSSNGPNTGDVTVSSGDAVNDDILSKSGDVVLYTGSAVNDDILSTSGDVVLYTGRSQSTTGNISVKTGQGGSSSGGLNLESGLSTGERSGDVSILSGENQGTGTSGDIFIETGFSAQNQTGELTLKTGYTPSGTQSGKITMLSGGADANTGGESGDVEIGTGNADVFTGETMLYTGHAYSGLSGNLKISTGESYSAADDGGDIEITTGWTYVGADSGMIDIYSGVSTGGDSGSVKLRSGIAYGWASGNVEIGTGDSSQDVAGDIILKTGNSSGSTSPSSNIILSTGHNSAGDNGIVELISANEDNTPVILKFSLELGHTSFQVHPNTVTEIDYILPETQGGTNTVLLNDGTGGLTWHNLNETTLSISDLTDVDTTGIQPGQVIKWNGSMFVPGNDETGGDGGGIEDAPFDGVLYGRVNGAWSETASEAQGALADTALQPGDNISELVNDAGYITSSSGIENVVEDTSPQLGGNLDTNGFDIVSTNNQITIDANTVTINGLDYPDNDGTTGQVLTTDGNGNLSFTTVTTGGVTSVFGRAGDVVAQSSDYSTFYATSDQGDKADSSLQPGDNISQLNNNAQYITIDQAGETNTASNEEGGEGIFRTKNGADLRFKALVAGTNITLSSDNETITINSTGGGAGGEVEEAPDDGKQYGRQSKTWTEVQSGSSFESIRVNYHPFGTIMSVSEATAGITSTSIDGAQWINFEFTHNRPPASIIFYAYKDLGANGWGYKMSQPSTSGMINEVLTGGSAGNPAELLTNMASGKLRLQARNNETFADGGEHAYIFFLF